MQIFKSLTVGFLCVAVALFAVAGCKSSTNNICAPSPVALQAPPNLTFRVIDKITGQDLFFGTSAKYNTAQLKVHHLVNNHPDTAFLHIDTPDHKFNVSINANHLVDTVLMNIADKPQDTLLFRRTTTSTGCYTTTFVNAITFNGKVVFTPQSGPEVVAYLEK